MNNILSFDKYRGLVRQYESMKRLQYESENVNEGLMNAIKKYTSNRVDKVLSEEIELGKQIEEKIKTTMEELSKACDGLDDKTSEGSEFKKKLSEIIDNINKTSFDALSLLGDADIDFGGFKRSAVMANVINLGVLFSPIKNALILRRAYKYFIGLIKQALRKDMVMLLINFDQFQNMILEKSLEVEEDERVSREIDRKFGQIDQMYMSALSDAMGNKHKGLLDKVVKATKTLKDRMDMDRNDNPLRTFFQNSYDNTYKATAENLKQYIGEDNQKMLDAHKNSINKLSSGDDKLGVYGELLISIAEEKSLKTSMAIHTNFLKISDVFKLSNQKKLVEMMQKSEKEYQEQCDKLEQDRKKQEQEDGDKELSDFFMKEGEDLSKSVVNYDTFDKLSGTIDGPDKISYSKKEILTRYLTTSDSKEAKKAKRKLIIAMPLAKDDADYDKCYLSYLDVMTQYIEKMLNSDSGNYVMSFKILNDKVGREEIEKKFFNSNKDDILDDAVNAIRIVNSEIKKFNYKTFLDKLKDCSSGKVTLNEKQYNEFVDLFDYLKKYIKNDYSAPSDKDTEKSGS